MLRVLPTRQALSDPSWEKPSSTRRGGGSGGGLRRFHRARRRTAAPSKAAASAKLSGISCRSAPGRRANGLCKVYHFFRNLSIDRRRKDKSAQSRRGGEAARQWAGELSGGPWLPGAPGGAPILFTSRLICRARRLLLPGAPQCHTADEGERPPAPAGRRRWKIVGGLALRRGGAQAACGLGSVTATASREAGAAVRGCLRSDGSGRSGPSFRRCRGALASRPSSLSRRAAKAAATSSSPCTTNTWRGFLLKSGDPAHQAGVVGMAADARQRFDVRVDGHGFAKEPHLAGPVHDAAAQRAHALVAEQHRAFGPPEIVLEYGARGPRRTCRWRKRITPGGWGRFLGLLPRAGRCAESRKVSGLTPARSRARISSSAHQSGVVQRRWWPQCPPAVHVDRKPSCPRRGPHCDLADE